MLPLGHISASYLIASTSKKTLRLQDLLFIIFCGNIFDLDYPALVISGLSGALHHHLPTHTPFFGLIYFLIFYLFLKNEFSQKVFILAALAMLSHLILDNLYYFLTIVPDQSINWFWPLTPMPTPPESLYSLGLFEVITLYRQTLIFKLELLLSFIAILVLIKKQRLPS